MERYGSIESVLRAEIVEHQQANDALQRALDAEREKVAFLEKKNANLVEASNLVLKVKAEQDEQLATLQAQLAAMTESRDAWRLAQECSEKAYMSLATQIPSERYDYDPVNLALLDGAKEQERIGRKQIADLQAQLRQVEGERDEWERKCRDLCQAHGVLLIEHHDVKKDLTTLRQLVSALPVVDAQEVSVWLSPDESGWLVSKRPAFPAGLYWAKFRTQAEADSFRALLAYRATLAQDAGKAVSSG